MAGADHLWAGHGNPKLAGGLEPRPENSQPRGQLCSCSTLAPVGAMVSHRAMLPPVQRPPTASTLLLPPTNSTARPCLLSPWCHHSAQPWPSASARLQ